MGTSADSYSASFPRLQRVAASQARRILHDRSEADDVVQDALLRAYVAWDEIAGYDEAWVGRVAINLAISRLRRKTLLLPLSPSGAEPAAAADMRVDVARAVDALPRRQRQVVVLRYVADLPVQGVAELLNISVGSVKRHLHRAMAALREPSAGLSGTYRVETPEEELMNEPRADWRTMFHPAAEPTGGWPPAPWDHRWFEAEDDQLQRLACDHRTGEPILDAEGDEVRTGPGMDFVLVKADRTLSRCSTPWEQGQPEPPLDRLDLSAREVLDQAARVAAAFSAAGVGIAHIAIALLDLLPEAPAKAGIDSPGLRLGLARFSEGPHAEARVALVDDRLNQGWVPSFTAGALPLGWVSGLPEWLAEAVRRVDYFDGLLPEEEPTLMVRAVDLLHLIIDPAPRYYFLHELIERAKGAS